MTVQPAARQTANGLNAGRLALAAIALAVLCVGCSGVSTGPNGASMPAAQKAKTDALIAQQDAQALGELHSLAFSDVSEVARADGRAAPANGTGLSSLTLNFTRSAPGRMRYDMRFYFGSPAGTVTECPRAGLVRRARSGSGFDAILSSGDGVRFVRGANNEIACVRLEFIPGGCLAQAGETIRRLTLCRAGVATP